MEGTAPSVSRGREGIPSIENIRRSSVSRDHAAEIDGPRGREPNQNGKISTGRGGIGNIVRSPSRDIEPESRGHVNSANILPKGLSSGRGGAGNIRSPSVSRDVIVGPANVQTSSILAEHANTAAEYEREIQQRHAEARKDLYVTGRGGLGNISNPDSRSRSRSQGPAFHSSGRGGAGNIQHSTGDPEQIDIQDGTERLRHAHPDGTHSTGRGGIANLTDAHGPRIEVVRHHEAPFESSGRGGAGNIRDRSVSREPGSRNPSKDKHNISQLWNKVTHPHTHVLEDPDSIQEAPGNEGAE